MVPAVGNGAPRSKTVHGNPVSSPRNRAEQHEVILLDDLDIRELHGVQALHRRLPQYGSEKYRAQHAGPSGTHRGNRAGAYQGAIG